MDQSVRIDNFFAFVHADTRKCITRNTKQVFDSVQLPLSGIFDPPRQYRELGVLVATLFTCPQAFISLRWC